MDKKLSYFPVTKNHRRAYPAKIKVCKNNSKAHVRYSVLQANDR